MASPDDLWLIDFGEPFPGEPAHHRPALVVGPPDQFGPAFPFVIVCPLTSARRELSLHVEVEPTAATGLDQPSYIQCELLRSISTRQLIHRLGAVDLATSSLVHDRLRILLDH